MPRLAVLVLGLLVTACAPPSPCGPAEGKVVRVVDGDTLELESGVKLRLLLTDTPETTSGKADCYGAQAVERTQAITEGKTVQLSYDDARCQDMFGRTLAYVKVGGVELNSTLVKDGLACTLFIAPAGASRRDEFETYEVEAKTARTGMWGACSSVPCDK